MRAGGFRRKPKQKPIPLLLSIFVPPISSGGVPYLKIWILRWTLPTIRWNVGLARSCAGRAEKKRVSKRRSIQDGGNHQTYAASEPDLQMERELLACCAAVAEVKRFFWSAKPTSKARSHHPLNMTGVAAAASLAEQATSFTEWKSSLRHWQRGHSSVPLSRQLGHELE